MNDLTQWEGKSRSSLLINPPDVEENLTTPSIADIMRNVRAKIMNEKTDSYYIGSKNGFAYVKANYLASKFAEVFPIHKEVIVGTPQIIANAWIVVTAEVTAYLDSEKKMSITKTGFGAQRIMIPKELRDDIKMGRKPVTSLTPLDWIDVSNDVRSAGTKAFANAHTRFGFCSDVYERGIVPEDERLEAESTIEMVLSKYIANPMDLMREKKAWSEWKTLKKNPVVFLFNLTEKYDLDLDFLANQETK